MGSFSFREKELAKKYYDKLFKEYCIADLSRYKENKVRKEEMNDFNKIKINCEVLSRKVHQYCVNMRLTSRREILKALKL